MSLYPEKIESYEEGRAFTFTVNDGETTYRFTVPSDLLDDEVGVMSTEETRKAWVEHHLADILNARPEGVGPNPPFNRILVEEIS